MKGQCLCAAVAFELKGRLPNLYQCHCSLCRKTTGSSANAAFRIADEQFDWLRGADRVRQFQTESGFRSHFCANCGSPLPNPTADGESWWVPVGLLEDNGGLRLAAHLFVASKASWDVVADVGQHFEEMPDGDTLQRLLEQERATD